MAVMKLQYPAWFAIRPHENIRFLNILNGFNIPIKEKNSCSRSMAAGGGNTQGVAMGVERPKGALD